MQYRIRHTTRHHYDAPVSENVMEVRLRPRTDAGQSCQTFALATLPKTKPTSYVDYLGNTVHTFDVPIRHKELLFVAESVVDVLPLSGAPRARGNQAWAQIDAMTTAPEFWEMSRPTVWTGDTPQLRALAGELEVERTHDPLTAVTQLNQRLHEALSYNTSATHVHSSIDDALATRSGVCQDFSHIMLALLRNYLRMHCRYASGYLYHREHDTSVDGASHAWLEAYIPEEGWVGFDPTNNILAGERHIRVAYGRDYSDAAPTRGVFNGAAASELSVAVSVQKLADAGPLSDEESWPLAQQPLAAVDDSGAIDNALLSQLQQQQQQQQ